MYPVYALASSHPPVLFLMRTLWSRKSGCERVVNPSLVMWDEADSGESCCSIDWRRPKGSWAARDRPARAAVRRVYFIAKGTREEEEGRPRGSQSNSRFVDFGGGPQSAQTRHAKDSLDSSRHYGSTLPAWTDPIPDSITMAVISLSSTGST